MTRIRFEDLPSTNTPRNAENLNKLNNVVISSTEPTTDEEVWIQKGKNLFDKDNYNLFKGYLNPTSTGSFFAENTSAETIYIKCLPNTTYTVSRKFLENNFRVGSGVNIPITGEQMTQLINEPNATEITITTGENDNYLYVYVRWVGQSEHTLANILDSLQIEQGDTATPYESYINKKIHTKNDNGVYEEFYDETNLEVYSTNEQRIGIWIDGKPLYRKIFKSSFSRDWSDFSISDLNADTIYINYGKTFANFTVGTTNYVNGQFYASETDFFRCFISKTSKTVQVAFASQMTNREATIVVEYTKTTD